jgi:hypothetical protein
MCWRIPFRQQLPCHNVAGSVPSASELAAADDAGPLKAAQHSTALHGAAQHLPRASHTQPMRYTASCRC